MAAVVLGPITDLTHIITKTVVHPYFFPYTLSPTIHAARTSIAYQAQARANGSKDKLPWAIYLAGFLIMSWGGTIWTHVLLSLPPPPLYAFQPWIIYLSVHLFTTAFFHLFPSALAPRVFDTTLILVDAVVRLNSITSSLSLLHNHPDQRLSESLFLRLIIGAIASAGGGVTAATLAVWTPDWRFSTPVFLKGSILSTTDIWGGSIVALVYDFLIVSHPVYQSFLVSSTLVTEHGPLLSPDYAKSVATLVLASIFAWRVTKVHWTDASGTNQPKQAQEGRKTQ